MAGNAGTGFTDQREFDPFCPKCGHSGMESMNRKAAKIAIIDGELGKAKGHLKNVVRVLIG
ncbi:MAG: hypothetical protein HFG36_09610 [Eubacterium sp.]|nr:hypothetical protein [Eubacterium sp.]